MSENDRYLETREYVCFFGFALRRRAKAVFSCRKLESRATVARSFLFGK